MHASAGAPIPALGSEFKVPVTRGSPALNRVLRCSASMKTTIRPARGPSGSGTGASDRALPPAAGRRPVIDRRVIAELAELGRRASVDLVRELILLYLEDATWRMTEIRAAARSGDLTTVRRFSHGFYGSAGNVGASALALLCEQLEVAATEGRGADVSDLVPRLAAESRKAAVALRKILEGGPHARA